ncbi:hypothetical protein KP806_01495 [Paenibacillus sp. N4]|uniref:hypothetical protein n=1 Tax=Paenibacillus vietnamensis TaxID=2590547 RepID=UPI001CD05D10|nr:hypothetical protein [Paenibacillus vietnamensis]MCA0753708.1 hypothetical protein [Paenibacillus vietnamensis]
MVVAFGVGAAWLLQGDLDYRTTADGETKRSLTAEASAEPSPSAATSPVSRTPDGRFALFAASEQGWQSVFTIKREDGTRQTYDWPYAREWGKAPPALKYSDLNNGGIDELVVHWTGIASDGDRIEKLRVIDACKIGMTRRI